WNASVTPNPPTSSWWAIGDTTLSAPANMASTVWGSAGATGCPGSLRRPIRWPSARAPPSSDACSASEPATPETALVERGVGGVDGDGSLDAALPAQDGGPQVIGAFGEGVAGQGGEGEPGPAGDLLLELTRRPARVAGEDPH